jgi:hypothetical protein
MNVAEHRRVEGRDRTFTISTQIRRTCAHAFRETAQVAAMAMQKLGGGAEGKIDLLHPSHCKSRR